MIPFNIPPIVGKELGYIEQAINNNKISGDGIFTNKCNNWLESHTNTKKVLLTTSCTHALEMVALLINVKPGDEVIMPSYTFVSTANAFVLRGAKIVFVDIRPDTMNIDEKQIEGAVTSKTKAIVPVHYAGVSCEMNAINAIAKEHNLYVIEDAAQGMMATYKGQPLGTMGDFGCYSFHETKNYSMGEGGAILMKDQKYIEKAEIIREKGTNRSRFFRGQIDKYSWVDHGSSYLPSELNAAYLWAQLERADEINQSRLASWNQYREYLNNLYEDGCIQLPYVPDYCNHNGHMFYIKVKNLEKRSRLISYLKDRGVLAVSHYVPLHNSPAGKKFGVFFGDDIYTTRESDRIIRLPIYYGITEKEVCYIAKLIETFFRGDKNGK